MAGVKGDGGVREERPLSLIPDSRWGLLPRVAAVLVEPKWWLRSGVTSVHGTS